MIYSNIDVVRPKSLEEAKELLSTGRYRIVAGATDTSVMIKDGVIREGTLLDISCLDELKFIRENGNMVELGPLCTFSECLSSHILRRRAPLLIEAISRIGSPQVRNLGTVGGNIGTGSPAGDTIPPLYVLNAIITLESLKEKREVPIEKLFLGPKKTCIKPEEIITMIRFEGMTDRDLFFFKKLGLRNANAIAVVSVAALLRPKNGGYDVRIALGSVAPTVVRAHKAERVLSEGPLDEKKIRRAAMAVVDDVRPITDVRGSAEYRKRAAMALLYQGLYDILHGFRKGVEI